MTKANESKPLVVGLAGFGTVGGGLARLLKEHRNCILKSPARKQLPDITRQLLPMVSKLN